jgi:cephalosporin hydroxylase
VVHHIRSGRSWELDEAQQARLSTYRGFRPLDLDDADWLREGLLVNPDEEALVADPADSEEGALRARFERWYWAREVEAERDYRWMGEVVLKLPEDLFLYQELITAGRARRIVEVGAGRGGGLWFFASLLQLLGGGVVVGVERDPPAQWPAFDRFDRVKVVTIVGEALAAATRGEVEEILPAADLVVVDAGRNPAERLALAARWGELVAPGGLLVIEDLWGPPEEAADGAKALDAWLLADRRWGIEPSARRFPLSKLAGGVFCRLT